MSDPLIKFLHQTDIENKSLTNDQMSALKRWAKEGSERLEIANHMLWNNSAIISTITYMLFSEKPQLFMFIDNYQKSHRIADLLHYILKCVTYALIARDFTILDNSRLSELRQACAVEGFSIELFIDAIKIMRDFTLTSLTYQQEQEELTISEIHKSYPKQWITIQVTKSENGFPSAGKVVYFHYDLEVLTDYILGNENIMYTFFTSKIDEKPEPLIKIVKTSNSNFIITSDNQSLLKELKLYFDKALSIIL